jgi:hypothetical protein
MEAARFQQREPWLALAPGLHIGDRSLLENVAYLETASVSGDSLLLAPGANVAISTLVLQVSGEEIT